MRTPATLPRTLAAALLLGLPAAALAAAPAGAYPASHGAPRIPLSHRSLPPTTGECEAEYGISCYGPTQIEKAYGMPSLFARRDEGQGQTIVIVDSFGSPTIQQDLAYFDSTYHLPAPPSFKIIQPAGALPPYEPAKEEMAGWAGETTLDIEYSHTIAPKANLLLVETPVAETEGVQGFPQIVDAENYVISHRLGGVISQSFSATEETFPTVRSLLSLRTAFESAALHGVTVLGAAGDEGVAGENLEGEYYRHQVNSWPSSDPLVTSVGGTQLHLNEAGERTAPDNVWNEVLGTRTVAGGGGPSHVFGRPLYQYLVQTGSGGYRATPDISMSAAVNGGVVTYGSYPTAPGEPPAGWEVVGGTSEATPLFAGIVAIADQVAGHPLGLLNPRMYLLDHLPHNGIVDITKGNNAFTDFNEAGEPLFTLPGYEARPGYDMASGLGTIEAFPFVNALAGR